MMAQTLSQTPNIRSDPKFSKSLTGDFTFDLDCQRSRCPPFLLRNIRRLLSYHQKSLHQQVSRGEDSNHPPTETHQGCGCAHSSACQHYKAHIASEAHVAQPPQTRHIKPGSVAPNPSGQSLFSQVLPFRVMGPSESASRRSARKLQEQAYDNDLAELSLNLCNIRKLLNFTSNRPGDDERSQKRVKRDHFKCQCSLTIWDNRPNLRESDAIVKRSVFCTLTSVDNGIYGPCVLISLDKPFVIKASELKVPVDRDGDAGLEIVDSYFMEFKVIPTRSDVNWPPVPILGKSDGDHYSGPGKLPAEALAGALVMKHKELPRAPESNTPLKAFFLYNGVTYKTKYGLEVSAGWKTPAKSSRDLLISQLGIETATRTDTPKQTANLTNTSKTKDQTQALAPGGDVSLVESVKRRRRKVKVIYHFEHNTCRSQEVLKQYRTAEVSGLVCPACPTFKAQDLQELRFHFLLSHHKYNFALGELTEDEVTGELREVVFEVSPVPIPKPTSRSIKHEEEFEWIVKATPFDLAAFLDGDTSWLGAIGEEPKAPVRKPLPAPVSDAKVVDDPASDHRLRNNGFLPADNVREFRKSNRKKHPIIKLVRRIDDKVATYNSITHRQTFPSEEPMSDTDDDVEDEWFIQRHLENLDIAAKEESWDSMKWELFRRWDRHRLEEKLEHTRFLSDSLIRFVRKEKLWLSGSDANLQAAFQQLLADLTRSRFINAQVSTDVQKMITDAKTPAVDGSKEPKYATPKEASPQPTHVRNVTAKTFDPAIEIPPRNLRFLRLAFIAMEHNGDLDAQKGTTGAHFNEFNELDDSNVTRAQIDEVFRKWSWRTGQWTSQKSPEPAPPLKQSIPEGVIAAWRTTILAQPPDHCGDCAQPILKRAMEGIHCSSPTCPTSSAWFHLKCVKLKKRRANWVCLGCRSEMRLGMLREGGSKGKGKEVAVQMNELRLRA